MSEIPSKAVDTRPTKPFPKPIATFIVRDKDYYHASGDLVFTVGDTLFKIHRFQLERSFGSSSTDDVDLFLGKLQKPTTKEESLTLPAQDKVEEFRALCWALYAPPHEIILQYNASNFDLKLILNVFTISHKYHLESLQKFANQLLIHHCTFLNSSLTCKTSELESILRFATQNNVDQLTGTVSQVLLDRLDVDQTTSVARLITLAEELKMRHFQGKLYYHELIRQETSKNLKSPFPAAHDFPLTDLTEKQSFALFRGYRSLLRYWQHLPEVVHAKKLTRLATCKDHPKCQEEWDTVWGGETRGGHPSSPNFGPLEWLEKIQTTQPTTLRNALPSATPFPKGFITLAPSATPPPHATPSPFAISTPFATLTPSAFATPAPIGPGPFSFQPSQKTQPGMRPCGHKELGSIIQQLVDTLADHFLGSEST